MPDRILASVKRKVATSSYHGISQPVPENLRGRPEQNPALCREEGACINACPTGAISGNPWRVDLGKCIFCGLCEEVCSSNAIKLTGDFELASHDRAGLVVGAGGEKLEPALVKADLAGENNLSAGDALPMGLTGLSGNLEELGQQLKQKAHRLLRRSLHIRHLDTGSCNGCDWELNALLNPVHDIQRFGIDFVASPRHADLLLVTGTMTRNLTIAAIRTYRAMPEPRLVVAVGACGCSGGVFDKNYAGGGGTDTVLPVDVYIPGCPPRPQALIYGLLLAMGRVEQKPGAR